jgi:hypothetical protein
MSFNESVGLLDKKQVRLQSITDGLVENMDPDMESLLDVIRS